MNIGTKNAKTDRYRSVVVSVIKKIYENKVDTIDNLPNEIWPDGTAPVSYPTLEEERQVVKNTAAAVLGKIPEPTGEKQSLSEIAKEYLNRLPKQYEPGVTVTNVACNKCTHEQYLVSNFCRGCVARPCAVNCPKKTISFVDGKSYINQEGCIKCGTCARVCPFNAIQKLTRPCAAGCPVKAITVNADGVSVIDKDKCIHCGRCIVKCPFGAIFMSTQVGPVVQQLVNKKKKIVAMWAPATLAQFPGTQGQWAQACLKAGFTELHEVAVGADVTSITETTEFLERVGGGKIPLMTTSCCPAFVRSINLHIPGLQPYVSTSKSPMGYSGDLIKARDGPDNVITVFVGPCTAKRQETLRHPNVDYAITSEELLCIFTALDIDITKLPEEDPKTTRYGSTESANYCVTQGVTQAVVHAVPLAIDGLVNSKEWGGHMSDPIGATINIGPKDTATAKELTHQPHAHAHEKVEVIGANEKKVELKPIFVSPLTQDSFKQLQTWGSNISKVEGNLIECMCCDGGCIGGPGNIVAPAVGLGRLKKILTIKPDFKDIEDVMALK